MKILYLKKIFFTQHFLLLFIFPHISQTLSLSFIYKNSLSQTHESVTNIINKNSLFNNSKAKCFLEFSFTKHNHLMPM